MADQTLNAEGLNCPLPILKAKKMLKGMSAGDILNITATDPGSAADFTAFCTHTGNELMGSSTEGDIYKFQIKRA